MIEAISQLSTVAIAPQIQLAAVTAPPQPSSVDIAQFQAALHGTTGTTQIAAATNNTAPLPEMRPLTPGDTILRGLDKLRTNHRNIGLQINNISAQPNFSPVDLIHLQMHVNQVMLGTQLVTQVASKIQQDMTSLLKSS